MSLGLIVLLYFYYWLHFGIKYKFIKYKSDFLIAHHNLHKTKVSLHKTY